MYKIILGMSIERKDAILRMRHFSEEFANHIIEYVVYRDVLFDTLDHWAKEIGHWLFVANSFTTKSKLKEWDYKEDIFYYLGDSLADAISAVGLYWENRKSKQYPDFEITDEITNEVFNLFSKIQEESLPILTSKKKLIISQWRDLVKNILDC